MRHSDPSRRRSTAAAKPESARSPAELQLQLEAQQAELKAQHEELCRTQAELERSYRRYRDVYESSPVGYMTLTCDDKVAEANLTTAALLGVPRLELLKRPFSSFLAPASRARWAEQLADALRREAKQTFELEFEPAAGRISHGRLDCLRLLAAEGQPLLRVALIDITEQKRIEDELRKHALVTSQSPDSIVITDLDGRIEYVNPAFSLVSGYSAEEALGQNPRVLKSGLTDTETYAELWTTLAAGKVWRGEFVNRSKDGTKYVETATISPLRQADGAITHYVAVKTNITELRQTIARLRASENRLRLAQIATNFGIFDRDLSTGKLEWDERMRELWGVGPDEPIDYETFMAGVHPDDRAAVQAVIDHALAPGSDPMYRIDYRVVNLIDGGIRHIRAVGQVFYYYGRAARIVGTVRDITATKRLESELKQRQAEMDLLARQQVAAQTAAAIAHEINQPLVSVSAYSEAALNMLRADGKGSAKLMRALEGAVEQVHRAGNKLHELLDFLHKADVTTEPIDLGQLVHDALAMAESGPYGGFRTRIDIEPGLGAVMANRTQAEKILVNLVHNGVEAMRGAGMRAGTIAIRVQTAAAPRMAQVTVQDNGPGLDALAAQRIFEPFFTTKADGIGLGLAISRALVESYGGLLWADLDAHPGATFHFTLPFAS